MSKSLQYLFLSLVGTLMLGTNLLAADAPVPAMNEEAQLQALLSKAYQLMDDEYYLPVSHQVYEQFVKEYPLSRLKEINQRTKKQVANVAQLGAGILVNKLKSPSDRFTSLVPAEKSKEFKSTAYAVTEDLGIEGHKTKSGFEITKVQKHCEAYEKDVRTGDLLLSLDGRPTSGMEEAEIVKLLSPVVGTSVRLNIFFQALKKAVEITLESKSYFKETVTVTPSGVEGVLILKIAHFNQRTSGEVSDEMAAFDRTKIKHLIIDLRDNGGGPPLAAREILGFFLPENDPLFAIARKKKRPVMLTAPRQPVSYHGPITALVDEKTGSAAELFSGLLQAKKIATLTGQKTAGATYLKGIYELGDGAVVFMLTSLTYFYDRRVFPADGLTPDTALPAGQDSLRFTLERLGKK